ncbi:hypothetical protein VTK56DRAFT_2447 [Thermocarpiscus australiensis]
MFFLWDSWELTSYSACALAVLAHWLISCPGSLRGPDGERRVCAAGAHISNLRPYIYNYSIQAQFGSLYDCTLASEPRLIGCSAMRGRMRGPPAWLAEPHLRMAVGLFRPGWRGRQGGAAACQGSLYIR